ncbi:MAG: TlpA family protein disulfide reductase [Chromatiaceae bacterium]|nr:TlpA family protein disulfide reductase [Chromatiaceae bacterium]
MVNVQTSLPQGLSSAVQATVLRAPSPLAGEGWGKGAKGSRRLFIGLLLAALFLVACGEEAPKLQNHQPAPAFALTDLDGKIWNFPQDFQSQVVVVRFWADWCPFCAPEMRDIEPIQQELRDQGLRVLAVNVRQDRETAARFIAKLGISYSVLLDEDGALARQYGVTGLPTTYFIDRSGQLHNRILGEASPQLFDKLVRELL